MNASRSSLAYEEPSIITIVTLTSFLFLNNVVNYIVDRLLYCGLLGQVFLGVAFDTPGGKWLSVEPEK